MTSLYSATFTFNFAPLGIVTNKSSTYVSYRTYSLFEVPRSINHLTFQPVTYIFVCRSAKIVGAF